ncbi:MAG: DNA topoisomerase VI subunit B [Bdellovibrionales bacterium RIFCSPHIGHO2_01_FULL_40_29]|nr:MAG: DNA topoisomerase VI subunit B [Bdellovibrionales bacterium RIFCSPHIGHO2_01_FULL_40_29]OFZ33843.1 MAG: DNA topoisomerase VI subunit B [Bdellovibrionales bacterium RIFCSPHIGHO2_02_FULL_40_15]
MSKITKSSTAEYFAKNLQQVGFSSPLKAVLTTLKEAVDNSLDACEEHGILPDLDIEVTKVGNGSTKNTDLVRIVVEDNGPGIDPDNIAKVFGEYLASSKFGRGQCSRGQQGIGISAATTWAQMTNARGVQVISKTKNMRKAISAQVDVDIKTNTGVVKNKEMIDWKNKNTGVRVEFLMDGRIQLNGDGGLQTYIEGTALLNPHVTMKFKLGDLDWQKSDRVSNDSPDIPEATLPHPHTFKLGEFITHATLYGKISVSKFLKTGFSRVSDQSISDFVKAGMPKSLVEKPITSLSEEDFKKVFQAVQATQLMAPSTKSVLTVGEDSLSKSINRLGKVDFFSVVTRKPTICDFKPVVVEVALARFIDRGNEDTPVQLLRFANRVPLQFDKSGCAITWAIESVNWKSYGLSQPKESLPQGPYVFAVSIVSPFIKFKNASKETIDASEELVEEIRRALMQAGQKLSRHIKHEMKEADLERKLAHIEQFGPILVEKLVHLAGANDARRKKAEEGLKKILGRDSEVAVSQLEEAQSKLAEQKKKEAKKMGISLDEDVDRSDGGTASDEDDAEATKTKKSTKKQKK